MTRDAQRILVVLTPEPAAFRAQQPAGKDLSTGGNRG